MNDLKIDVSIYDYLVNVDINVHGTNRYSEFLSHAEAIELSGYLQDTAHKINQVLAYMQEPKNDNAE